MKVKHYESEILLGNHNNEQFYKRNDPCFSLEYAKLYEEKENGIAEVFTFENERGKIEHFFIKRVIPITLNGQKYYDITSPYGYGGPIIVEGQNSLELLNDYFEAFHDYCLEQNIISEFVRFHLFENEFVREYYYGETSKVGPHVIRDLRKPLNSGMARDVHQSLNKAERIGLTIYYDTTGERMDEFLSVYNETMKRNHASDYYHFDSSFFDELHTQLKNKYIYVSAELDGQIISSRLAIHGEKYGFGFLGGTLKDYFHTQATTTVDYCILKYLKEKNCSYFSFGGGFKTNDGIYKYKKKFSKDDDSSFYIA